MTYEKTTPSLRKNIVNLFLSNTASFLVPLLQIPYLTRILGAEEFGLFIFSYSTIAFFMILTDYGLDLYAPVAISQKKLTLDELFTNTLFIKTLIFLFCICVLAIIYLFTNYYKTNHKALTWMIAAIFFNTYSILWCFQSMEIIYLYSRITVAVKLIAVAFVFILVKTSEDADIALAIIAISNAVIIALSFYILNNKYSIQLSHLDATKIKQIIHESFEYVASRLGVSVYATLGGVIIGVSSGNLKQVAYYSAAHQLYSAGLQTISAINTPLLPYMIRTKNYANLLKIIIGSLLLTATGSIIGIFFGKDILILVFGQEFSAAKATLNIFMITILFSVLGQQIGYPALSPLGKARAANLSVIYAGITQLVLIGALFIVAVEITSVAIASTYLICDMVMCLYRGSALLKAKGQKNVC